jgi:large subunit ribosomal protein L21
MTDLETTTAETPATEPVAEAPAAQPAPQPQPQPQPQGYAIIQTGGKQYRVKVGDRISVERLAADAGGEITFDQVLLLGGDGATRVGTPVVTGASVTARVDDHFRGEKIVVFKYKPKKRYRRRIGHRQSLTHLTITGIAG